MKKIKEEQLGQLVELNNKSMELLRSIGLLENQKHYALRSLMVVNEEVAGYKKSLEEEYGSISIDLATGEYKEIEADGQTN